MKTTDSYAIDSQIMNKQLIASARETVQTAEDTPEIAVRRPRKLACQTSARHRAPHRQIHRRKPLNAKLVAQQAQSNAAKALEMRDSARGPIVNMSDVLFETPHSFR
jgi:hypothetical protein